MKFIIAAAHLIVLYIWKFAGDSGPSRTADDLTMTIASSIAILALCRIAPYRLRLVRIRWHSCTWRRRGGTGGVRCVPRAHLQGTSAGPPLLQRSRRVFRPDKAGQPVENWSI